jgi:hypothetical protein
MYHSSCCEGYVIASVVVCYDETGGFIDDEGG